MTDDRIEYTKYVYRKAEYQANKIPTYFRLQM